MYVCIYRPSFKSCNATNNPDIFGCLISLRLRNLSYKLYTNKTNNSSIHLCYLRMNRVERLMKFIFLTGLIKLKWKTLQMGLYIIGHQTGLDWLTSAWSSLTCNKKIQQIRITMYLLSYLQLTGCSEQRLFKILSYWQRITDIFITVILILHRKIFFD